VPIICAFLFSLNSWFKNHGLVSDPPSVGVSCLERNMGISATLLRLSNTGDKGTVPDPHGDVGEKRWQHDKETWSYPVLGPSWWGNTPTSCFLWYWSLVKHQEGLHGCILMKLWLDPDPDPLLWSICPSFCRGTGPPPHRNLGEWLPQTCWRRETVVP
jgi:hypothetical protein